MGTCMLIPAQSRHCLIYNKPTHTPEYLRQECGSKTSCVTMCAIIAHVCKECILLANLFMHVMHTCICNQNIAACSKHTQDALQPSPQALQFCHTAHSPPMQSNSAAMQLHSALHTATCWCNRQTICNPSELPRTHTMSAVSQCSNSLPSPLRTQCCTTRCTRSAALLHCCSRSSKVLSVL